MRISRLLFALTFVFCAIWIYYEVHADYQYDNTIGSYWSLSEKASTLQQKSIYLDQYVTALEAQNLTGSYDASFLQTPDNSYDQNLVALKSLQGRMHQIQGMDEQSFAYQTAIQQITAQEQGEAGHLTSTFEGCWYLRNNSMLWGWHDVLVWLAMIVFGIVTGIFAFRDSRYY
jgi:hypothetical protein